MKKSLFLLLPAFILLTLDSSAQLRENVSKTIDYQGTIINSQSDTLQINLASFFKQANIFNHSDYSYFPLPLENHTKNRLSFSFDNEYFPFLPSHADTPIISFGSEPVTFNDFLNYSASTIFFGLLK